MQENYKSNKHSDSLAVLIDLIPDPVVVIDHSGKILNVNNVVRKFTGYNKEQLIGKNFSSLSFISEEYKQLLAENTKDRLAGSNIPPNEIRVIATKGEGKCLKVKGKRFITEGEPLDLAIFHDITQEENIQNQLRKGLFESEEKFHIITNSIKEAIIVVDEEAKVINWNPGAEKTFGYTSEEAIGKDIHKLVVPNSMCKEGKDDIAISVKTFSQTGIGYFTVGNVDLVGRYKDGNEFPVELSIYPTKLKGKWSAVGVVRDITKRKEAEQKLRDAEQRFHTIFNQAPLGIVVVDPETTAIVEFNDVAHRQLGYSREIHLELREESPKKLIAESLGLLHLPKKIEIQNQLNDEPAVKVDVDKIKRVFVNLIKNAIDAMPNGGKITIDSKRIKGSLEVSFSDTGEGIAEDVLPKLFSPLFATKAQGMGFGLSICKCIIEAHVALKTVKYKGTTYVLTLPIKPKFEVGGENTWINILESS